jgi:hypothetical protein
VKTTRILSASAAGLLLAACTTDPTGLSDRAPTSPRFAGGVTGAAFTGTNPGYGGGAGFGGGACINGKADAINCNIYSDGKDVWLSAGPAAAALGAGQYFFAILVPSGQNNDVNDGQSPGSNPDALGNKNDNLSDDFDTYEARSFTVSASGVISPIDGVTGHVIDNNRIQAWQFHPTTNRGGVYTAAICKYGAGYDPVTNKVTASSCKFDNFRIVDNDGVIVDDGGISGAKYYDANRNGQRDLGEAGIGGWRIDYTGLLSNTITTDDEGQFSVLLPAGSYTFAEQQALGGTIGSTLGSFSWEQTGNTVDQTANTPGNTSSLANFIYSIGLTSKGSTSHVNFGNVCKVNPGGRTIGYHQNKAGTLAASSYLSGLVGLNLVTNRGVDYNPAAGDFVFSSKSNSSPWGTWLNVQQGFTSGDIVVDGTRTISDLISYADGLIAANKITVLAGPARTEQARVKDIFDAINNSAEVTKQYSQPRAALCGTPSF